MAAAVDWFMMPSQNLYVLQKRFNDQRDAILDEMLTHGLGRALLPALVQTVAVPAFSARLRHTGHALHRCPAPPEQQPPR